MKGSSRRVLRSASEMMGGKVAAAAVASALSSPSELKETIRKRQRNNEQVTPATSPAHKKHKEGQVAAAEKLNNYLQEAYLYAKFWLKHPATAPIYPLHLISGNESCDLDSVVCTLSLGYWNSHDKKNEIIPDKNNLCIPFFNIEKEEYSYRTEVTYLMKKLGIHDQYFLFRDDFTDFENLVKKKLLRFSLVDHNHFKFRGASLLPDDVVKSIFDHHVDEGLHLTASPRKVVVPCGSCTSILVDHFRTSDPTKFQTIFSPKLRPKNKTQEVEGWAELLLSPIILDTVNFDAKQDRTTELDMKAFQLLKDNINLDPNKIFWNLHKAKYDVSKLSVYQLLRKDYKDWTIVDDGTSASTTYGISTLTLSTKEFFNKKDDNILKTLENYCSKFNLSVLFGLTAWVEGEEFHRGIVLFCPKNRPSVWPKKNLMKFIQSELKGKIMQRVNDQYFAFEQPNGALSRKILQPIVHKFLSSPESRTIGAKSSS